MKSPILNSSQPHPEITQFTAAVLNFTDESQQEIQGLRCSDGTCHVSRSEFEMIQLVPALASNKDGLSH